VWLVVLALAATPLAAPAARAAARHYGVGEIVVAYTDHSRLIYPPRGRPRPRTLVTVILYPAAGAPSLLDVRGAPPARGPFPLVVFAHGFNITPYPYLALLQAWASAGYVVAAPIFPLTSPGASGGPDEADLVNQPGDVSFVISRMLIGDRRPSGILSGLIEPGEIAVSGQSDGGSTALAAAYAAPLRDPRLQAAMIFSGAEIPGVRGYFAAGGPPLLAVQGTADTSNSPYATYRYFALASAPKFLLRLWGAPHLGPYTGEQPYLGVVERASIAFLDRYLKHRRGARARLWAAGDVPGVASLSSGS
jgi:dienelactone hydrolase